MFFKNLFGRQKPQRDAAQSLYLKAVEKARDPLFYTQLKVADTVDGRFDLIVVHVMLVMRRLRAAASGAVVAQALFDFMFQDMDRSLREMGVGDLSVGRHIKTMAKAFYGRAEAYEAGIDEVADAGDAKLTAALRELIYRQDVPPDAVAGLADYVMRADRHLQAQDAAQVASGAINLAVPVVL